MKINKMNTRSNSELIFGHALLHAWWKNPKRTSWTRGQIRLEHARLVRIMKRRGIKHNSPLK